MSKNVVFRLKNDHFRSVLDVIDPPGRSKNDPEMPKLFTTVASFQNKIPGEM